MTAFEIATIRWISFSFGAPTGVASHAIEKVRMLLGFAPAWSWRDYVS